MATLSAPRATIGRMIIKATLETIETGAIETTTVECQDYTAGFEQLKRTLPEGMRLLPVNPQR